MSTAIPLAEPFTHSPGFGGLCAVVAAVFAATAAILTVNQRTRADNRSAWWDRFTWIVDRIGTDLTGPLAIEMLSQMESAARKLHDDRLVEFIQTYTQHVYRDNASLSPDGAAEGDTEDDDQNDDQTGGQDDDPEEVPHG